ncbi:MAG: hypothetical protein ACI9P5_004253 [Saprospiraceae bacterium]|jgi:hypothetical protein
MVQLSEIINKGVQQIKKLGEPLRFQSTDYQSYFQKLTFWTDYYRSIVLFLE